MKNPRTLILLAVAAHWTVAVWHLFLAAKILPAPSNSVSWVVIVFFTLGHLSALVAVWKLGDKLAGLVALVLFLAALGADLDEHFVQIAPNNVFMAASGAWTAWFDVSVFALVALEILGISLGIVLLRGRPGHNSQPRDSIQKSANKPPGFSTADSTSRRHL